MTADILADALARIRPVSLEALTAQAALMSRVDRKYVVPRAAAARVIDYADALALEIDGARQLAYESVYFDTPELTCYLQAARRRPARFKVRTRTYLDTGTCWLEVKTRDRRGSTVKQRLPYALADHARLTTAGREYVVATLADVGIDARALTFAPVLSTHYHRATLLVPGDRSRATLDTRLTCRRGDAAAHLPDRVVVETKTTGHASTVDHLLWRAGHRPSRISKYGTGLAALDPGLPSARWHRVLDRNPFVPLTSASSTTASSTTARLAPTLWSTR